MPITISKKEMTMKKIIMTLLALATLATVAFAVPVAFNETSEKNWTSMSYDYVPVYKVLEGRDAFVVIYQKGKYGVGNTTLPKKWAHGTKEEGPKLRMRTLPGGKLKPYLTVVKDDEEFKYVILTMPLRKTNAAWGVVDNGVQLDTDKDTLESLN